MSIVKSKKYQINTSTTSTDNFTLYAPDDGTLRIGVGNADSPTEVGRFDSNGYVATNAPAFKARISATQSITNNTWSKVDYDTTYYDEGSDFDTTNNRFVAPINGVYNFSVTVRINSTSPLRMLASLYKNGSEEFVGHYDRETSSSVMMWTWSTDLKLSADDYIEVYIYSQSTSPTLNNGNVRSTNTFSGHLVRAT